MAKRQREAYRFEFVLRGDLLRKMNYHFRIGDKIGAIERKYARMQIHNLRSDLYLHLNWQGAGKKIDSVDNWLLLLSVNYI